MIDNCHDKLFNSSWLHGFRMFVTTDKPLHRGYIDRLRGNPHRYNGQMLRCVARSPACGHFAQARRSMCATAFRSVGAIGHSRRITRAAVTKRNIATGLLASGCLLSFGRSMAVSATMSEIEQVLDDPKWPAKWPFNEDNFKRYDELPDGMFYSQPRFVYHIDEAAVGALTKYYAKVFPASGNQQVAILDICSSWVSHYPEGYTAGRIAGLGMNDEELKGNKQLTEWTVRDLNMNPSLPYEDNSFDVVTNCVSVDYLNQPLKVFQEIHRVLKPGGTAIMSFSNRCFPTKAISLWTMTGDADHVWIVGSYFHYSVPGGFSDPKAVDISPNPGRSDPMYVVYATKKA